MQLIGPLRRPSNVTPVNNILAMHEILLYSCKSLLVLIGLEWGRRRDPINDLQILAIRTEAKQHKSCSISRGSSHV